jgi:hypothetical protein
MRRSATHLLPRPFPGRPCRAYGGEGQGDGHSPPHGSSMVALTQGEFLKKCMFTQRRRATEKKPPSRQDENRARRHAGNPWRAWRLGGSMGLFRRRKAADRSARSHAMAPTLRRGEGGIVMTSWNVQTCGLSRSISPEGHLSGSERYIQIGCMSWLDFTGNPAITLRESLEGDPLPGPAMGNATARAVLPLARARGGKHEIPAFHSDRSGGWH